MSEQKTDAEILAEQERLAPILEAEFNRFADRGTTDYLNRKLCNRLFGARIQSHEKGFLVAVVPLRDVSGKFWSYQRIFPTKFKQADGKERDKFIPKGSRTKDTCHILGEIAPEATVYVCEGFATGASIYQALGETSPVVVALYASNLPGICQALKEKHPKINIVVCADNDQRPGKANAGRAWGKLAADASGGTMVYPVLPGATDAGKCDFNDIHVTHGLEMAKAQILSQAHDPTEQIGPEVPATGRGVQEASIVLGALSKFEGRILRQGKKDFFLWHGTHWEHMDPLLVVEHFKRLLDIWASGTLKAGDLSSAFERFLIHVPTPPKGVNMFAPDRNKQNFSNGTLHIIPNVDARGTYRMQLKPHDPEDYLMHCHEFPFVQEPKRNPEFEAALDRIWAGDPDIECKKQAYFEVLGACLVGSFRKIAIFVGPPKTGKSTLVMFAAAMVHDAFKCKVDPAHMEKFNMTSMGGKLLNYVTELNLARPVADHILKQIEDGDPIRIERKGLPDIYAPLPGMHLLAGNRMFASREGGEAYDRRMLVFRCDKYSVVDGTERKNYAQWVWEQMPDGIVSRAVEGLARLCENGGHFTVPASSRAEISQWQEDQGDPATAFFNDWKQGIAVDKNNRTIWVVDDMTERGVVWGIFSTWWQKYAPGAASPTRNAVYTRLRELGVVDHKGHDGRYFKGMAVVPGHLSDV